MNTIWIFLISIRPLFDILKINTSIITFIILLFQMFCLFIKLNNNNFVISIRILFFLLFFILIGLINTRALSILSIVLAYELLRNEKLQNVLFSLFICSIISLFLYFSIMGLGFGIDKIIILPKGKVHNLGFHNSNLAGSFFLSTLFVINFYLNYNLKNSSITFFFLLLIFLIYKLTLSRTTFFTYLIFFILNLYYLFNYKKIKYKKLLILLPVIIFIIIVMIIKLFNKLPFIGLIEIVTSGRFFYFVHHFKNFSFVNIFIGCKRFDDNPLDCSYIDILFNGGIVGLFFIFSLYKNFIIKSQKDNFRLIIPMVICLLIGGIFENIFSTMNIMTLLLISCLSNITYDNYNYKHISLIKKGYLRIK